MDYCDYNGDGTLNACEIHDCVVACENEWRAENCPTYGELYCECPFPVATCEGAWSCEDIEYITNDIMTYYDVNGNDSID